MAIKSGTLVQLDWVDSESAHGWQSIKEVTKDPQLVHSVGYVIADNDKAITLAADVGEEFGPEDTVNRTIVIPKGMVQKVKRL